MTEQKHTLHDHMFAIGQLCVVWAQVDRELNNVIQAFLKCQQDEAASIGTALDSVSGRCELIKNLGRLHSPSNAWRLGLEHALNYISKTLAPLRNRYVHDHWMDSDGSGVVKVDRRVSSGIADDGSLLRFQYNSESVVTAEEIGEFSLRVFDAATVLQHCILDLNSWNSPRGMKISVLLTLGLPRLPPIRRKTKKSRPQSSAEA